MAARDDDRLALVLDLARQVTARHDLDDVLATTFRCLRPMLAFSGGSIQLLDDEGWIRMAATDPAAPPHVRAMRIPLGSTVGGRIILTERPVYVPDVLADAAVPPERRRAVSSGVRSYLGVPMLADGRAIGLIQVDSEEPDAWNEDERVLLASVAPIVAAAIQNARAHERQTQAAERLQAVDTARAQVEQLLADDLAPAVRGLLGAAAQSGELREAALHLADVVAATRRVLADMPGAMPSLELSADDARASVAMVAAAGPSGSGERAVPLRAEVQPPLLPRQVRPSADVAQLG